MVTESTDRVIYIGTTADAYEVVVKGREYVSTSLGLKSNGAVRGFVVDRRDNTRLYAGTGTHGMLRSTDVGRTWSEINDGIIYKNIFSLSQHPSTFELYAGTEPANVFCSTDGGDGWVDFPALTELPESKEWDFPRPPHVAHIRDIALREGDPDDVFAAIEDGWLVRSRDRGVTWKQVRHGVHPDAHTVTFMPDDNSIVYAATGNFGYRSTDGGTTFTMSSDGLDRGYMAGVVVHAKRPEVLLTASSRMAPPHWRNPSVGADLAIYRSEDQGLTWTTVGAGLPHHEAAGSWSVAGDPEDPDAAFIGLYDGRVFATHDGGESCQEILQLDGSVRAIAVTHR